MNKVLLGIDIGTTGLKTTCYLENGTLVDKAYREYQLSFPQEGFVEINPEIWWKSLCECIREIKSRGKVHVEDIIGIGITCTNSLILLDENTEPLLPAIMQFDQRAATQAESIKKEAGEKWFFDKTGNRVSAGAFWGPTLKWISENHLYIFRRVRYLLNPTSFLILKLTGVYCIDHSRASTTMLYNIHQKNWDAELCNFFKLPIDLLPPIYKSNQIVGYVSDTAELETGLKRGTPVVAGGMDTVGALIGLGVNSGNGALIMGSVGRFCMESDNLDIRFMNAVNFDGIHTLVISPVNSVGVSYKWIKNILFKDEPEKKDIFKIMDNMAETIKPGAEGLIYLPYLSGERSPIWDPYAKGSFIGLRINHTREHLIRAVLEGVGFALADNFEILKNELKINPHFLVASGGGAKSRVWMQIISDMLEKDIYIPVEHETETVGAAILAGLGTGVFSDLLSVQKKWIQITKIVTPQKETTAKYQEMLLIFREIYLKNKELFKKLHQF
ncbi:MAG: xylulokinase [Candidatus Petromonas sp.]|nr:xylulokinase [Candidatus Petromonas sp.]